MSWDPRKRLGTGCFVSDVVELQDDELVALFGMAKEVKRGLEDGSYWVEQQQVVTFLLSTIGRCDTGSRVGARAADSQQRTAQSC